MPNTAATCSIDSRQQQRFDVNVFDKNNVLDNTSEMDVVSTDTGVATVTMINGRSFQVVGQSGGTCDVNITVAPGFAAGTNVVHTTVTEAPDLRHIDISASFITAKPLG